MMRGRYAPSPTGDIHLGNARSALVAWWAARAAGGAFVWRVEDIDGPRAVEGLAERQMKDLAWLGIDWDEGPDVGGPSAPYTQSQRSEHYVEALRRLDRADRLFPCRLTRRELKDIASAPHRAPSDGPYPPSLRPETVEVGWLEAVLSDPGSSPQSASVRLRVDAGDVCWTDALCGEQRDDVRRTVGDFVLRRRDGVWAYQLAVVVDDAAMQVDQVVRGCDLMSSTARQIVLQRALGAATPEYAHVPLLLGTHGDKLSKRDEATTLRSLRSDGVDASTIVGLLAWSLGLVDEPGPRRAGDVIESFDWSRIDRRDVIVADDVHERLVRRDRPEQALRPAPNDPAPSGR